jgi:site-specific DNA recombinase
MKVIEFRRVSTDEQAADNRAGLARQKEANARTIERYKLEVADTIELIGVSGTEVVDHPVVRQMIKNLKSDGIRGLVVADQDRLIRLDNLRHLSLLQDLIDAAVLIYFPDRISDLTEQQDWLLSIMQAAIAGNELKQMRKRIEGAKEAKRKAGKHPSNHLTLPLGVSYDREQQKFFYNDDIWKVKNLFDLFYNKGIQNFRDLERETGIKHRTIANLLRNELYVGIRAYTLKRSKEGKVGKRKKIKRSPNEIIRVKVIDEPIIDEKMFREVQYILDVKNKEYHKKRPTDGRRFLYSGFLRCGVCGEIMYSTSGGKNHQKDYYCCKRKKTASSKCLSSFLPKEKVEETITSFVTDKLTDQNFIKDMIEQMSKDKQLKVSQGEEAKLQKNLMSNKKRQDRLIDLYEDGQIDKGDLILRLERLGSEEKILNNKLELLESQRSLMEVTNIQQTIKSIVSSTYEFPFWTATQKRQFLRSQLLEFAITKEGVTSCTLRISNLRNRMGKDSWQPQA